MNLHRDTKSQCVTISLSASWGRNIYNNLNLIIFNVYLIKKKTIIMIISPLPSNSSHEAGPETSRDQSGPARPVAPASPDAPPSVFRVANLEPPEPSAPVVRRGWFDHPAQYSRGRGPALAECGRPECFLGQQWWWRWQQSGLVCGSAAEFGQAGRR